MLSIDINTAEVAIFFSILLRVGIILFMLPIFSAAGVPTQVKALIVVAFSFMLFPIVRENIRPLSLEPVSIASVAVGEVIYGTLFSLAMLLIIMAFQMAGDFIAFEMGFGFSQTADPQTGAKFTVLAVLTDLLATLLFFAIQGHHVVIRTLVESFDLIPVGSFSIEPALFTRMLLLSGTLFTLALKLASPVLAVLILTQIGLGLISKFAPQVNILATSFPLTITVGMLFFGLTLVLWGEVGVDSFTQLFHFMKNLAR